MNEPRNGNGQDGGAGTALEDPDDPNAAGGAPDPADPGHADGSPRDGDERTSPDGDEGSGDGEDGNQAVTPEQFKQLRQRLTTLGEGNKKLTGMMKRLMAHPDFESKLKPFLLGDDPDGTAGDEEKELETLATDIFGEGEGLEKGKRLLSIIEARAERRALKKMQPVARAARETAEARLFGKALRAAGVAVSPDDPAVVRHRREFESENPWIDAVMEKDPVSAAKLIAQDFSRKQRGNRERDLRDADDSSLERSGTRGGSPRLGARRVKLKAASAGIGDIFKVLEAGGEPDFE